MTKPVTLTDTNFQREVLESKGPVLVDFWAEWCGPCRVLGPIIEELADENSGAKIAKLNIDENPKAAGNYGLTSVPTVLLFKDGELHETLVGVQPKRHYIEALERAA